MPNRPLDRNSFEPLYFQLAEKIKLMINTQYSAGDLLPSESELITRYQVSRNTVRQSIELLEQQGFVISKQGKGTFVSSMGNRYQLQKMVSFSEDMRRRGLTPDSRLLKLDQVIPPDKVSIELKTQPGELVYMIYRLRMADDEPMALSTAYIPCSLIPELTTESIEKGSLYDLLRVQLPYRLGYADRMLKPATADREQASLLQVPIGSALMRVEGPAFLENDQPVEYVITFYRGDRYEFAYRAVR